MKVEVKKACDVKVGEFFLYQGSFWKVAESDASLLNCRPDALFVVAIPDAPEQPKEKTYTREEVAKVLCPYCADGLERVNLMNETGYAHVNQKTLVAICQASDWLKATEKGE